MRTTKIFAFGLVAILLSSFSGCERTAERKRPYDAAPHYSVIYDIALVEVDRSAQAKARYGAMILSRSQVSDGFSHVAEDRLVKVVWLPPDRELSFEVLNKTGSSLRIPWDESAYVDITGQTHRLLHSGVKFTNRKLPQPPSILPSQGRLADFVYPSDLISYVPGGWAQPLMFPCVKPKYVCHNAQRQRASAHKGLSYRVLLPLQVGTEIYTYTFTFKVNNVEIANDKQEDTIKKAPRPSRPLQ
jgi:hypothetical protein